MQHNKIIDFSVRIMDTNLNDLLGFSFRVKLQGPVQLKGPVQ